MRNYLFITLLAFAGQIQAAVVDAAFPLYDSYVMIVKGDKLIKFDMNSNTVVKTTYLTQNGLPDVTYKNIDAALNYGNGKVYLFSGSTYVKFDITSFKAEAGYPKSTTQFWPGVSFSKIDAATHWTGKSYFFSGDQYVRFNDESNTVDAGYPKKISTSTWGNVPFTTFDAAFSYKDKSYFFSGDQYVQYDIKLDRMDAGYPKKIAEWQGLNDALGLTTKTETLVNAKPVKWNETQLTLSLGEQRTTYDNRADVEFNANGDPVMIYSFENDGSYIQSLNKYWVPTSNPIHLKGLYFWDFLVIEGNYYVIATELAGYKGDGPLDYEKEGNILVFLKIKPDGTVVYKKNLFGHEGVKGGQFFLCTYSSNGKLAFDGTYFHAFVETCGNFSAQGSSSFDVHEGDYYLTMDMNGDVRVNGRSIWNHSHSNILQLVTDGVGEAYTLEVSDGGPWGINFDHFSNGKRVTSKTLFPDASRLPYEDMYSVAGSTTDAGQIGGVVRFGELFYTVIATVPAEKQPILEQQKDLLFTCFDKTGAVVSQKWIRQTANVDESVPFIIAYGENILMIYMNDIGKYVYDYKATVALLNLKGEYVVEPYQTDYILNWQSRLISFPNGDVGLIAVDHMGSNVEITRFGSDRLPNRLNNEDAQYMTEQHSYTNATVKPLMPVISTAFGVNLDLRKPVEENVRFNGSYQPGSAIDSKNGVYCDGVYRLDHSGFSVYLNDFDFTNFTIEVEFNAAEMIDAPVFSISSSYRTVEYFINSDGYLQLFLNNGELEYTPGIPYKINTWYTARMVVIGDSISMYLDGKLILTTTATLKGPDQKGIDIVTTSYANGRTFKGYLRSFKIGQAK